VRVVASLLALALVAVTARTATPAVYRWVDEQGVVHYSDREPRNPEEPVSEAPLPPSSVPDRPRTSREVPPPLGASGPLDSPTRMQSPAPPPRPEAARAPGIRELMERMHYAHDAEQTAGRARHALFEQRFRARNAARLWSSVNAAFSSEALIATGAGHLARALGDSPMLPQMLAWLRSPLGRRVMDLGAQPDTPARQVTFRRFALGLPDTLSVDRIRLVREFGRSSDFVPLARDVMTAIDAAITDLVDRSRDGGAPAARRTGRATGDSPANDHLRWFAQMTLLFDFRELRDDELQEAITFWKSPVGRTLSRAYRAAVLTAIATAHARAATADSQKAAAR